MVWTSLVRGRFKESLQVGEKDVAAAAKEGGEQTETEALRIQDAADRADRAAKGRRPAAIEARKKEAEALRERVQSCEEANSYFKSMQNAAIRDVVTKTSADLPGPLRELLDKTPIGHLTAARDHQAGRRDGGAVRPQADHGRHAEEARNREKMYTEKYEAKSKAYLKEIRKAAMIEYR